jgi:nitrite reductase/ring-hydroxylating ferredoxin subunit
MSTGSKLSAVVLERDATDVVADSAQLIYLCDTADLVEGEGLRIEAPDLPEAIAVFHADGKYFALNDTCSHAEASLSEGYVEDCKVECPLHFARFDLDTGRPCSLPAIFPVKRYPLTITDGRIYIRLAD